MWMKHFWLANPYGLANQKLCCIQIVLNIEKSLENNTKNILKNGWWIQAQVFFGKGLTKQ